MDEEAVRKKVQEILAGAEAANFGAAMAKVMAELKNQADGALVKKIVEEELAQK
jgi:uncharacterized protein YqeY